MYFWPVDLGYQATIVHSRHQNEPRFDCEPTPIVRRVQQLPHPLAVLSDVTLELCNAPAQHGLEVDRESIPRLTEEYGLRWGPPAD